MSLSQSARIIKIRQPLCFVSQPDTYVLFSFDDNGLDTEGYQANLLGSLVTGRFSYKLTGTGEKVCLMRSTNSWVLSLLASTLIATWWLLVLVLVLVLVST